MIDTKLILVEGPPGSGKSTTANLLAAAVARTGRRCQCLEEWSQHHPITIGDDLSLDRVVATAMARHVDVLRQWQQFARDAAAGDRVTVMESRFWQTGAMLLYAAGLTAEQVVESNRSVTSAIAGLMPTLIYFTVDDLRAHMDRTIRYKEGEWRRGNMPGSWAQHIYEALDPSPWALARGLSGLVGALAFLEDWRQVADRLYAELPFPKMNVVNPSADWGSAMREMLDFLELEA